MSEWISVLYRIPDVGVNVLAWSTLVPWPFVGSLEEKWGEWDTKTLQWIHRERGLQIKNVTHWQPLPEPPKDR